MKRFSGKFNWKGKLIFYAAGLFFFFAGMVINFVDSSENRILCTGQNCGSGNFILGFGLFFFLISFIWDIPLLNFYLVGKNYFVFVRVFWKKISFENIAEIRKIKWTDLKDFTSDAWKKMTLARYNKREYTLSHLDEVLPTAKTAYKYNQLVVYCTATPVSVVSPKKTKSILPRGDYILITLVNGQQYVISPKDVNGFLNLVPRRLLAK